MDLSAASSAAPQASNGGNAPDASGGGDTDVDFRALFEQTNAQLEETKSQSSRLASELEGVKGSASQSSAELARIKAAIMGKEETAADPVADEVSALESEMDQYLQAAIEHERSGRPIPLTINSAVKSLRHQISQVKENAALRAQLAELKRRTDQVSDPQNAIEATAYSNMDNQIETALQSLYGNTDANADVREAQFQSISRQIVTEIKDLKKNDPGMWDRIRRDRKAQVNLVNHFVKKTIPPKAREIMDADQIRRTPLTNDELMNAYREAKEQALKDPKAVQYASQIRQELLSRVMEKNMGGGSRNSRMGVNDLFEG